MRILSEEGYSALDHVFKKLQHPKSLAMIGRQCMKLNDRDIPHGRSKGYICYLVPVRMQWISKEPRNHAVWLIWTAKYKTEVVSREAECLEAVKSLEGTAI